MEYGVRVPRAVTGVVSQSGLSREGLIKLYGALQTTLGRHADQFRGDRDPDDPTLFRYQHVLADRGRLYVFTFWVNDSEADQGRLRVQAVAYQSRPWNP